MAIVLQFIAADAAAAVRRQLVLSHGRLSDFVRTSDTHCGYLVVGRDRDLSTVGVHWQQRPRGRRNIIDLDRWRTSL